MNERFLYRVRGGGIIREESEEERGEIGGA